MKTINWSKEVAKRKGDMLQDLKSLLSIESVFDKTTISKTAPFGQKIAEALQFVLGIGKESGFLIKNVDGYAGHIEYGGGQDLIGVLSHIDVVPAADDGWKSPPFKAEIREGKIYARGAIDDKGPTIAALYALKIIKEIGLPLSKRVRLILGTDEESLWRCMDHYFQIEEMPLMGFTPDANFPIVYAEKGLMDVHCICPLNCDYKEQGGWSLLEFTSGDRSNMVPDLAIAKLNGQGDIFELKELVQHFLTQHSVQGYAEESDDCIKIIIKGRSHHGSEPEKGLNAALKLATFLSMIPLDLESSRYISFINNHLVDSFYGEKLSLAQEDNIVGKLTINAGVFNFKNKSEGSIDLNIRYPIATNNEDILETLKKQLSHYGFYIHNVDNKNPHFCEPNHTLITTLSRVYEEQTGEKAVLVSTGGGTYARALKTGVAFGPVFPNTAETAHQNNEYIEIEDLLRATAIYAQAIYELAK